MTKRGWLGVGAAMVALVGALVLYDALVITDEERGFEFSVVEVEPQES